MILIIRGLRCIIFGVYCFHFNKKFDTNLNMLGQSVVLLNSK